MANLTPKRRKGMPKKDFAGPGRSFPINDKEHARLAIGGATRAERAGNISSGDEARIKKLARAKLGDNGKSGKQNASDPGRNYQTSPNNDVGDSDYGRPGGRSYGMPDEAPKGGHYSVKKAGGSSGASDGLGGGSGGMAIHSSARKSNMHRDGSMWKEKY